jgi:acetoin utilization deacetylase AcuC-like enzyme
VTTTAFVTHHDCSRHDTGWAHPEHQGRLPAIARAVYREMLSFHEVLREMEGAPASEADLLLAHDRGYLNRVREGVAQAEREGRPVAFEGGTMLSAASWDALTASAGCAMTAADALIGCEAANAFCAVRPPGSGAGRSRAGNHAIINCAAVAALHLRERRGLDEVLILEWGEHYGSGTADIVADDPGIRYLSMHSEASESTPPEAGRASVPLPRGAGAGELLEKLEATLPDLLSSFRPRMVILSLGLDVLASDPHGTLAIEPSDLYPLTKAVMALADEASDGRLLSILEGGYDPPAMGTAVVNHLKALAGIAS